MSKIEKAYLWLLLAVLALVLLSVVENTLLLIMIWVLAVAYVFGGYWLFYLENLPKPVPIAAGIALGAAMFILPWAIRVNVNLELALLLAIPNLVLFILSVIRIIKNKVRIDKDISLIAWRSGIIIALTGFFLSSPMYYTWAHRQVLWVLNPRNESLRHNIRMFDFGYEADEHLSQNNCKAAIKFANAARKEGELWLEWEQGDSLKLLHSISGVLVRQYDAYSCQGHQYFEKEKYTQAYQYYSSANQIATELLASDSSWIENKIGSLQRMAECKSKLFEFAHSDSLYLIAIEQQVYRAKRFNEDLADMLIGFSNNNIAQGLALESIQLVEKFLPAFQQKGKEAEGKKGLLRMYLHLIQANIREQELDKASLYLNKGFKLTAKGSLDYYKLKHYQGYLYLGQEDFKKAIDSFKNTLLGYDKHYKKLHPNQITIRKAVFLANMAAGNYTAASKYIMEALSKAQELYGKDHVSYYELLKEAALLDERLGNYADAKAKLEQVAHKYNQVWGDNNMVPEVYALLANIETELDNKAEALSYADKTHNLAKDYQELQRRGEAMWLNLAKSYQTYGFQEKAKSIYEEVLIKAEQTGSKLNQIVALSGLSVIEAEKRKIKKAEKLLKKSIDLAENTFNKNHPLFATLCYNQSQILLAQGKYDEALLIAEKVKAITDLHFKNSHPNQADYYILKGDIRMSQGRIEIAEQEYKKAEKILKAKFKNDHREKVYLKQILAEIMKLKGVSKNI